MFRHRFGPLVLPVAETTSRRTLIHRMGRGGLVAVAGAALGPNLSRAETDAAVAITEAWTAAWNSHDPAAVAALFTADGTYEDLAFDLIAQGTAEIVKFAEGFFTAAPDLAIELRAGFGTAEWAAAEWLFSGTDTGGVAGEPTGKRFEVWGATIFELDGEKARRNTDYYNPNTVLQQLGLLP